MSKNLVIVESPSKSKTIEKYLGSDFKVLSSKGHIRDLATSGPGGLGIDVENDFAPKYRNIKDKKSVITSLKAAAKKADHIYLATDPDREGESISWHLAELLKLDLDEENRVVFNEITKNAVIDAFNQPRKVDLNLVRSQETRRMLDRIIGFKLSKLLQNKIKSKSAGRVQSVALRLIVEREREIEAFIPDEYWEVSVDLGDFKVDLKRFKGETAKLTNKEETDVLLNSLGEDYTVEVVDTKKRKKKSKPPFITSTLQQVASAKLGFNPKKTMRLAQELYEGIELDDETVGLITYMRTDSKRLSDVFIGEGMTFIEETFGKEYVGSYSVKTKETQENIQDAHEAIRPTSAYRTPKSVKKYLSRDAFKLYNLIYARGMAALMADTEFDHTKVEVVNNEALFRTTGKIQKFDGYLKLYGDFEKNEDVLLPEITVGEVHQAKDIDASQHFTKPPARFNEASLIKKMEELGIGRPSTYAQTMDTITKRRYVKLEEKRFVPTEQGVLTNDKLQEFFEALINVDYTRDMEALLDKIANGNADQIKTLREFYDSFEPLLNKAYEGMEKIAPKLAGEDCPECGHPLVHRQSRYGEFIGCSNYPECRYIKPKENEEIKEICDCPKCNGKIIEKRTRRGKIFYACNNYPECDYASWDKPLGRKCPDCNEMLVEKKGVIKCSACEYEENFESSEE